MAEIIKNKIRPIFPLLVAFTFSDNSIISGSKSLKSIPIKITKAILLAKIVKLFLFFTNFTIKKPKAKKSPLNNVNNNAVKFISNHLLKE